ncbi:MAG: GHMP family kinase ATP-binding protein [Anaerolineae bacterium]
MQIKVTVPMRVDLAGGTLDVYPLYLFEEGGITVNAAIDIRAHATLITRDDARIVLHSQDLDLHEEFSSLAAMDLGGRLGLVKRALAHFSPETGLEVRVRSEAPAGSGLGASSALLMALMHGLNALTSHGLTSEQIIDLGANLEAQVIGIPTGKQDYFPPIYGGVCAMWFGVDGWRQECLSTNAPLIEALNERLIVSYTGIPHDSSVTNWAMLKAYIEREGNSVARMREIKAIALAMHACLRQGDMTGFARLLDAEWRLRKGLAEGVTTPRVDEMMAAAQAAGALASKICGAGGGGCMITAAEPKDVPTVRAALVAAGAKVLPARVVAEGIRLTRS